MSNCVDKYVVCPFYTQESGSKIFCEGFSDTNSLQTFFKTKNFLLNHKVRYCRHMTRHKLCPLYTIINEQYKEDSQ